MLDDLLCDVDGALVLEESGVDQVRAAWLIQDRLAPLEGQAELIHMSTQVRQQLAQAEDDLR